jgi:hypothetical protein
MAEVERSNWHIDYSWSPDSGLRLGACDFKGLRVLYAASVPFVYVHYAADAFGPFTDRLRSVKGVVETREIMFGFDLKATYDLYGEDYQYEHVWRFQSDGQFGSTIVIQGPGEEIYGAHTYHIPFRFDLDVSGRAGDNFQRIGANGSWADVETEGQQPSPHGTDAAYHWRVLDRSSGRSVSIRARDDEDAELWPLQYSDVEHWSSWGGALAAAPGSPGSVPAVYASGQSVQETDLVVWYIARVSSRDIPTTCGPRLKLDGYGNEPAIAESEPNHGHAGDHDDH